MIETHIFAENIALLRTLLPILSMELDHKFRSPKRRRIFCKLQPHKTCNKVSNVVMHQCMYCIVGMFAGSKRMGALYRVYSFVFVMLITKYGSLLYIFLLFNSASYLCPVFEKVCSCFFSFILLFFLFILMRSTTTGTV